MAIERAVAETAKASKKELWFLRENELVAMVPRTINKYGVSFGHGVCCRFDQLFETAEEALAARQQ